MNDAKTRVLLFGSTGAVGRGCLDVLTRRSDLALVIAGRDETRLGEVASAVHGDIEVARVDIADTASVSTAVDGYDVVINCAGPSERFSAQVAGAAAAAGVPYVDPGGDHTLLDRLTAAAPTVPVVLQAGVQPGLSGLLLRILALHRSGTVDSVTAWCGGLQPLTSASVLEYLASLRDIGSHSGAQLRDGVIRRVSPKDCKPASTQYFPDSVTVHPHLDGETVAVAEHLGIGNVQWLNVFDGIHTTRAMQLLAVGHEHSHNQNELGAVQAAAKLDLFGRRPYFAIVATADGESGSTTIAFTCPDSYRVTGALTAFAARHIVHLPTGVHPFWRIEKPQQALDFVTEAVPGAEVSITDDSMIEEGSL